MRRWGIDSGFGGFEDAGLVIYVSIVRPYVLFIGVLVTGESWR